MATSRKARPIAKNTPQPFRYTLSAVQPLAPAIPEIAEVSRRTAITLFGAIGLALLAGILGGLAIRNLEMATTTVNAGSVASLINPQHGRITAAQDIAKSGQQTLQVSWQTSDVQQVDADYALQVGTDVNTLLPVLSAYEAQGSVNGPAR